MSAAAGQPQHLRGVPSNWPVGRLKRTVRSLKNGSWGEEPNGTDDLPCVRVADFDWQRLRAKDPPTVRSIAEAERIGRILRSGDLLLEKSGGGELQPVGRVVMYDSPREAVCSNFIARAAVASGFDSRFLAYIHAWLYSCRLTTRSIKQTTGIQNLDSLAYLNELVPLPSLNEQRAIAGFLDRETARIDELIAKKEKMTALLDEKYTFELDELVRLGGGGRARPTAKTGEDHWKVVPVGWHLRELRYLTPPQRKIMYGIVLPGPDVEEGVLIVKGGNCEDGRLRPEFMSRTTHEIEASYARSRLTEGDIVYSIRGTIGSAQIVPKELAGANLTQDAARISPRTGVNGGWLLHAVRSRSFFAQLEAGSLGAAVRGINIRDLKRARLPVPPAAEQGQIVTLARRQRTRFDQLSEKMENGVKILRQYRSSLISAAVTGQIDVRTYRKEPEALTEGK